MKQHAPHLLTQPQPASAPHPFLRGEDAPAAVLMCRAMLAVAERMCRAMLAVVDGVATGRPTETLRAARVASSRKVLREGYEGLHTCTIVMMFRYEELFIGRTVLNASCTGYKRLFITDTRTPLTGTPDCYVLQGHYCVFRVSLCQIVRCVRRP
jgi:hypothetical protein